MANHDVILDFFQAYWCTLALFKKHVQ